MLPTAHACLVMAEVRRAFAAGTVSLDQGKYRVHLFYPTKAVTVHFGPKTRFLLGIIDPSLLAPPLPDTPNL